MLKSEMVVEDSPRDSVAGSATESAEQPLPEDVIRPPIEPTVVAPGRVVDGMSPLDLGTARAYPGYTTPDRARPKTPPHYFASEYGRRSYTGTPPWHTPSSARLSRSYSVASNCSSGTAESKLSDGPLPDDPEVLQMKVREQRQSMDHLRVELYAKKEEVSSMRTKLLQMSQELNAVSTSKGVLNEACVTGIMDCWALQNRIAQLQGEKEQLERANDALRRESLDNDRERRGLLNLLDDGKETVSKYEEMYNEELKRRADVETSRAAVMERLGLELKYVRRELQDKTLRLKKLARTNTRLACKLLSIGNQSAEAKSIAKSLQQQNQQLDNDNQELSGCVTQLEQQIEQLAVDKNDAEKTLKDLRAQHAERLESERATLTSKIQKLQKEMETVAAAQRKAKDKAVIAKLQQQMSKLAEDKSNLQKRVSSLNEKMEQVQKEHMAAEEAVALMRKEYVAKLEEDTGSLRAKIHDHERALEEYRSREADYLATQEEFKNEVVRVQEEKSDTMKKVENLEELLVKVREEKEKETSDIRQSKEKEIRLIQQEKDEMNHRVDALAKHLSELEEEKLTANEAVRRLKQDIRESERKKETLNHQVNALEWHMQGLFREKQEAVRDLEDRSLELIRLQQDLSDKNEDLQRMREEVMNQEVAEVRIRELEISHVNVAEIQDDAERVTTHLEKELEILRKEKAQMSEKLKQVEQVKRKRPWLNLQFKIHC